MRASSPPLEIRRSADRTGRHPFPCRLPHRHPDRKFRRQFQRRRPRRPKLRPRATGSTARYSASRTRSQDAGGAARAEPHRPRVTLASIGRQAELGGAPLLPRTQNPRDLAANGCRAAHRAPIGTRDIIPANSAGPPWPAGDPLAQTRSNPAKHSYGHKGAPPQETLGKRRRDAHFPRNAGHCRWEAVRPLGDRKRGFRQAAASSPKRKPLPGVRSLLFLVRGAHKISGSVARARRGKAGAPGPRSPARAGLVSRLVTGSPWSKVMSATVWLVDGWLVQPVGWRGHTMRAWPRRRSRHLPG
jgi:hypothetical protein